MRFNWGNGIFILVILFILAVAAFIIFSRKHSIQLVEDDYYEKELNYQDRIDGLGNTASLQEKVRLGFAEDTLKIIFPDAIPGKDVKGLVWFYRPADRREDFSLPLDLDHENRMAVDMRGKVSGKWIIKLEWSLDGKQYYQEEIMIK